MHRIVLALSALWLVVVPAAPARAPFIDTHTHFDARDPQRSVEAVLRIVNSGSAAQIYLQVPPFGADEAGKYEAEIILSAAKPYAGKIGVLGGGGSLNPMIMQSAASGDAGPVVRQRFKERAEALVREGVSGFGEMTAEHFAGSTSYQSAPPDHPLYLLLADIAAEHGIPIDVHMEAVPEDMPLPSTLKSPPNAPQLRANIAAFERLLAHNRRTTIIWAHLGADTTGFRTPELSRRLLRAHPNLYLEIKNDPSAVGKNPVIASGAIKPEWLALFREFPDRFLLGSDQHYPTDGEVARWPAVLTIADQLPADLQLKIGTENARRVFAKTLARAAQSSDRSSGTRP